MFHINDQNALVLASESTRRVDLLRSLGVSFAIMPPGIDEHRRPSESPKDYVLRMAYEKAQKVAAFSRKWVIGRTRSSPTKAGCSASQQGRRRLRYAKGSGQTGTRSTRATASLTCRGTSSIRTWLGQSIKEVADEEIEKYIDTTEPFDKASSYAVQGKGG